MPERPLPPEGERISIREAAEIMGRSRKAVEQLIQRGVLPVARQHLPSGKNRVWTTQEWINEFEATSPRRVTRRPPQAPAEPEHEAAMERVLEELMQENIRLRVELAELQQRTRT